MGQTSADRTKPGPSFQLQKWPFVCPEFSLLWSKTAKLKVENSAQRAFKFSPVRYHTPQMNHKSRKCYSLGPHKLSTRCHDIQHKDTQYKDTQNKDTQHKDTQHKDTQHKDTQHKDTQHEDTQHNNIQHNDIQY